MKSLVDYLAYSLPLLDLDQPKIIFLEPHIILSVKNVHPSTQLVPFSKDELFFNLEGLGLPVNANPKKDTHEYFSIQLNKTDWVIRASEINSASSQFVWVDFGISHVCPKIDFSKLNREYENIRIPGCWNPKTTIGASHDSPNWFFCGGLFGGHIEKLREFDLLIKKYVKEFLKSGKVTWEVNIWKMVYDSHPHLFDWYYADHDCGMINNY